MEIHWNAFPGSIEYRTAENRRTLITKSPTYRPELDLVVVAPDGSFASFCIAWYDERNKLGVFEPVACHECHRRRGLTTALMTEALCRLKDLGATVAAVGAVGGNDVSNAFYESLGFHTVDLCYRWRKTLQRLTDEKKVRS